MSTTTTNLGLIRPSTTDPADITKLNENWDKLDNLVKATTLTSDDDLNNIMYAGYFTWSNTACPANAPNYLDETVSNNFIAMRVWAINDIEWCQEAIITASGGRNCIVRRVIFNSEVCPWEWVNPPMHVNTEYRTTERFRGEAVFVKLGLDSIIHKRTESGLDITPITYGAGDLIPGESELTTGQLYFMYE